MRNTRLVVAIAALMLLVAACGGKTAEEELLEQILENSGEDIGDVQINTDDDGNITIEMEGEDGEDISINTNDDGDDNVNITVEGEDGEEMTITGGGDDEEFTVTVEGEDGGTMSIGGGEIPDGLTLPVADGGDVLTSFVSDQDMSVMLIYPGAAYDQIAAFYEAQLPSGEDVFKSENSFTDDEGEHRSISWIGDSFMVSVQDCEGPDSNELDSACVNLTQFGS
ncbi:MAG: hypothetical protein GY722_11665 [bacterium]|nr:hypothetical protein [bacterium]